MKKYLLLIPLVIALISLLFFSEAYNELQREKHDQKFYDLKYSINLIAMDINSLSDLPSQTSEDRITNEVKYVDSEYMVYAALYTKDLNLMSERVVAKGEEFFNPFVYDEFNTAIKNTESGELTLPYNDGIHKYDEMTVYYEWAYTEDGGNKYLLISGISLYSTIDNYAIWISFRNIRFNWFTYNSTNLDGHKNFKISWYWERFTRKIKEGELIWFLTLYFKSLDIQF